MAQLVEKTVGVGAVRANPQELLKYMSPEELQELHQITETLVHMLATA